MKHPRDPATFFVKKHGKVGYKRLVELFRAGANGGEIGREFDVSRQRVHQWRIKFGFTKTAKKK